MSNTAEMVVYGLAAIIAGIGVLIIIRIRLSSKVDDSEAAGIPNQADLEIVAAISAALTVIMEGSGNIMIKSIRRVENNTLAWAEAGRQEQMRNRL